MNDQRLGIYLDDHLALMVGEIELAGRCRSNNEGSHLDGFLQKLESELTGQKSVVEDLIQRIGGKRTVQSQLKQRVAWFTEKVGRFKINDSLSGYSKLSQLVELETLAAAAETRNAMWDNLAAVAESDPRLNDISFSSLLEQSQQHFAELNTRRRFAAVNAFTSNGD